MRLLPLLALTLAAQTPSFEVASIRLVNTKMTLTPICGSIYLSPETVLTRSESVLASNVEPLAALVVEGYQNEVDDFDLPSWTKNNTFAVTVRIPPNTSVGTCRKMVRDLLAERFHMLTGMETRDVLRYHLKVAKSGLKLKPMDHPPADLNDSVKSEVKDGISRRTYHGAPMSKVLSSLGSSTATEAFALSLHLADVNSIIDETGLTGYYDGQFELAYSIASRRSELAESLSDAISRQLGLTLELRKTPGKVLVIRSSDRMPTEN